MSRFQRLTTCTIFLTMAILPHDRSTLFSQIAGSRAHEVDRPENRFIHTAETATHFIMVTGSAQRSVRASGMRMIWAVTSVHEDSAAAQTQLRKKISDVSAAWQTAGIPATGIVEDFISAIPEFDWEITKLQDGSEALVERQSGYRFQINLHVAVQEESQAMRVISEALRFGITDLIGVDYVADLNSVQEEVRLDALEAAKRKSETLLSVFEVRPKTVNVAEKTYVTYPDQLYASFENVASGQVRAEYDSRMTRIYAYRPMNTYYQGVPDAADIRSYDLAMNPEIVVRSIVDIYYDSPGSREDPEPTGKERN